MSLDIFRCDRRNLTLSTAGCARLFVSANDVKAPEPWEGRAACRACPVGSKNHTGYAPDPIIALNERMQNVCPRCCRRSSRLIWGLMCASCDVRQREALAGCNAKGTRPALSDGLHTERVAITTGGTTRVVTRPSVVSLSEVIIHAAKSATSLITFGRQRVQWKAMTRLGPRHPWTPQYELQL